MHFQTVPAIPLYQQVEKYLRELILQETYQNGAMLPKEEHLSKFLGVSRNTFRVAIDHLVRDGLIVRKRGIGTFVTHPKIATSLTQWDSFTHEMDSQGRAIETFEKNVKWIIADHETALTMGVETGTRLCRLDRLRGVNREPVVLFQSYFHPRIGIQENELFNDKLYTLLQKKYHSIATTSEEEIGAIHSSSMLRTRLQIQSDIPILYRKRLVYNQTNKLLELCYAYYRSDRFVYNIRIERNHFSDIQL